MLTPDTLHNTLRLHRLWVQDGTGARADLQSANLQDTYLQGVKLQGAHLRGAILQGAHLLNADLRSADLQGAFLQGADLRHADLRHADLRGTILQDAALQDADLEGALLQDADLRGTRLAGALLPTGESYEVYLTQVVPALCTVAGVPLHEVAAAWDCHAWDNCPMAVAFGVDALWEIPLLYRPRVEQFVQLFDAGLLPCPSIH